MKRQFLQQSLQKGGTKKLVTCETKDPQCVSPVWFLLAHGHLTHHTTHQRQHLNFQTVPNFFLDSAWGGHGWSLPNQPNQSAYENSLEGLSTGAERDRGKSEKMALGAALKTKEKRKECIPHSCHPIQAHFATLPYTLKPTQPQNQPLIS